ncbi:MAG: adenosylcobyric acid synthase [Spirochaetes bacterium]|nr:MAG: adenosylcobyric acid synthase [Spirochaetota bacterium]
MVQGTASSVGKSLVAAALCRIFSREGLRVAPFKSQNMSNNAAALPDGREIGRAQHLQALAARVAPEAAMNPILLKPESDRRSQVVVMGKPWASLEGRDYYSRRAELWSCVQAAYRDLESRFDLIVIEGAGSPAEINLQATDMANMAVARLARAPVILVADIDPGGVFAQVVGTIALLPLEDRNRVKGIVINKFRGDMDLLKPGLEELEELTGVPVLGVIPMLPRLGLPDEDGATIAAATQAVVQGAAAQGKDRLDIAVIKLPHISNFDDFDPLAAEPGVRLRYVDDPLALGLPLAWLWEKGFGDGIRWLSRLGTHVVGLCGGFQMLGERVTDLGGVEGKPGISRGLGLLALETSLEDEKTVRPVSGWVSESAGGVLKPLAGVGVKGYEIHCGRTSPSPPRQVRQSSHGREAFPFTILETTQEPWPLAEPCPLAGKACFDGAQSEGGGVWGTYVHGIFASDEFRSAWLRGLGVEAKLFNAAAEVDKALDWLADAGFASLDMEALNGIVQISP